MKRWMLTIIDITWVRVLLAGLIIIAGLAPVGASAISDTIDSRPAATAAAAPATIHYSYRVQGQMDGNSLIQRSADLGTTWQDVTSIPDVVTQVQGSPTDERQVFALGQTSIWRSEDAGQAWDATAKLPSRPAAMALAGDVPVLVVAGTESMGLFRSTDLGVTWQATEGALGTNSPAPLEVTAIGVNADDSRILYASVGYWLGTSNARLTPVGTWLSVDSGRRWFQLGAALTDATPVTSLVSVPARPLAVTEVSAEGSHIRELSVGADTLKLLDDQDPATRGAAARLIGLTGRREYAGTLLPHLWDADPYVGDQIAGAIGKLGDSASIPMLLGALKDNDEMVRARAAYGLGLLKADQATSQLGLMLLNDGSVARRRAAEALGTIGTPAAMEALMVPLADDELTPGRHAAMQGLELAGRSSLEQLAAALKDSNPVLRRNAAEMLGWLAPRDIVDDLSLALGDTEPAVRQQVAWALGEIGTQPAQRALQQAVRFEKDPATKQMAELALARTQGGTATAAAAQPATSANTLPAILVAMSKIPASRWTFLSLSLLLAALLIWSTNRRLHTGHH